VAVVTGGGSGIGRAMALTFAGEGMHVAVADVEEDAAEQVAEAARSRGVRALGVRTDVSDRSSVEKLAQYTFSELGVPHLLCNNAGVVTFKPVLELGAADWEWVMGVNFWGVVHGVQAFLPRMVQRSGEAHVVNTSSVGGLVPSPGPNGSGVYVLEVRGDGLERGAAAGDGAARHRRLGALSGAGGDAAARGRA
jgi:NAD(P)-dependent dehydrogenase (short-subunit alcohol dehydrogenase family)